MRNINFIKSATPQQQQSLHVWYRVTAVALLICITSITLITTYQLYRLHKFKSQKQELLKQVAPYKPILKKKNKLESDIKNTSKKIDQIKQSSAKTKQQYLLLKTIFNTCIDPITIDSVLVKKNFLEEVTIYAPDLHYATHLIEELNKELGSKTLFIASIDPASSHSNEYLISIRKPQKI